MKARDLLFQGSLVATFALTATFIAPGCREPESERRIEIWISPQDKPEILVHAEKEFWSHGSDAHTFNADIGPKLLQNHTVLVGELAWSDKNAAQALFSFSLTNEKPVTVIILGVSATSGPLAEKDARRTLVYPRGKHSFKEMLFVKYTYD